MQRGKFDDKLSKVPEEEECYVIHTLALSLALVLEFFNLPALHQRKVVLQQKCMGGCWSLLVLLAKVIFTCATEGGKEYKFKV